MVKSLVPHSTIKRTADLYGELDMEDVAEQIWTCCRFGNRMAQLDKVYAILKLPLSDF
jgi:hypothetical protein